MSRLQFLTLNVVGAVCALLIAADIVLGLRIGRLNQSVALTRDQFAQAQQVHNTVQNLVLSIARAGQTDRALRDLLARHEVEVNLSTNTPPRQAL